MLHPCKCYEAVPEPGKNYELANECVVLLEVRDSLEGTGLLNWSVHTPMTDWQGLTVEGMPPRVTKIDLAGLGLSGELPSSLSELTALTELRLEKNALTGRVPSKLRHLESLALVSLGGNSLTGCLPPAWQRVEEGDLKALGLPSCEPPREVTPGEPVLLEGGNTYLLRVDLFDASFIVFDVPDNLAIDRVDFQEVGPGRTLLRLKLLGSDSALVIRPWLSTDWLDWDIVLADGDGNDVEAALYELAESVWSGGGIPAPTLLVISKGTADRLLLEWTGGPPRPTRWRYRSRVQLGTQSQSWGPWTDIPNGDGTTRRFYATGLLPSQTYEYQVRGVVYGEYGPPSTLAEGATTGEGIATVGTNQVVEGNGVREWRVHELPWMFTIPGGMRVRVGLDSGSADIEPRIRMFDVRSNSVLSLDPDTGQELGRTVGWFVSGQPPQNVNVFVNVSFDRLVGSVRSDR